MVFVWEFCGTADSFDLLIGGCVHMCKVKAGSLREVKNISYGHFNVPIIHRQDIAL